MNTKNTKIDLYFRKGFKNCVTADCNQIINQFVDAHNGNLDIDEFQNSINVYTIAEKLYRKRDDIEKYNEETLMKRLFIKEIAYVIDRHIPFLLYQKIERMNGRTPKPLKNWAHYVFPKDKIPTVSAYIYKIDEDELAKEILMFTSKDKDKGDTRTETQKVQLGNPSLVPHKETHKVSESQKAVAAKQEPEQSVFYAKTILDAKHTKVIPFQKNWIQSGNFYALTQKYSSDEIIRFMQEFNYLDENYYVISGDVETLIKKNPQLFEKSESIEGRQDYRKRLHYYLDLVSGWIFEDIELREMRKAFNSDISIELNGTDKERRINVKPDNKADFIISYKGIKTIAAEYQISHSGYSYYENMIDLRNHKRNHLIEQNGILIEKSSFYTARRNREPLYAVIEPKDMLDYKTRENKYYGNKVVEYISCPKTAYSDFNSMIQKITNIFQNQ